MPANSGSFTLNSKNFSVSTTGNVTSSGAISASGKLTAISLNTGQGDYELYNMNQNVTTTSDVTFNNITASINLKVNGDTTLGNQESDTSANITNITSSGNISSSGDIISSNSSIIGRQYFGGSGGSNIHFVKAGNNLALNNGGLTTSEITASGNISASHASTASFGSMKLTNLPTTKPTTTGSLWLSGSNAEGTSKYLMVFTG